MKITITDDNINEYTEGKFENIREINWSDGELNSKVIDNFSNLQKLECHSYQITLLELYCHGNQIGCHSYQITSLEPLSNCIKLRELYCHGNQIGCLRPLSNCVNLQILRCRNNKITSLGPLSNCVNLRELDCRNNQITSLEPLSNLVNLQELDCKYNQITSLEPLSNCVNLQELYCCENQITSLEPLSNCVNLQKLDCKYNQITSLEPLSNCVNLKELNCKNNQITSLEPLSNCVNIQQLDCDINQITSLEPLSNCVNLQELHCEINQITSLEPLYNCVNLRVLYCDRNQITSLEPLIYLRRLIYIKYTNNPIEIPTMQIQRMLNRIDTNSGYSIYDDNQNVHDTEIQHTVCESVQSLLRDPKNHFSIEDVINSNLNKSTIEFLVEYCQDQTVHSVHLITYIELLALVWNRIINSVHKLELLKILEEQIAESECMCFTGRFNRTLSALVGFFDDIQINISDKSRISAIILNCKNKIIPYDSIKHIEAATKELKEAGYQETDFKDWIEAIED